MKQLDIAQRNIWLSGDYTGANRAMQRVTVQKLNVLLQPYRFKDAKTLVDMEGIFSSDMFGLQNKPVELPNLKSVDWTRDVDNDVPTVTLHFYNTQPLALGQVPAANQDFDQPGYYTSDRGTKTWSSAQFGHTPNGWADRLVPDNLIRTYEGYGFDPEVGPDFDPSMTQSGLWIITEVDEASVPGMIVVTAADLLATLISQINFPPVVPLSRYPLFWERYRQVDNPDIVSIVQEVQNLDGWERPSYESDSNLPYIGRGFTDVGDPYVNSDGSIHGHHGRHAFDIDPNSYFLSVGNHSDWSSAYEWVQGTVPSSKCGAVRVHPFAGPYVVYVSVFANGAWQGKNNVPYKARVVDAHTRIPYVTSITIGRDAQTVIALPQMYENVTKIRVTFAHLWNSGIGRNYPYRAAIRSVDAHLIRSTVANVTKITDGGFHWEGTYSDYTDLVKWWLAWAGWFWPPTEGTGAFQTMTDGTRTVVAPLATDPVIGNVGAIWGDFEDTGTNGPATLTVDLFDKKPILDCIHYVRDIIGWNFWGDETGGAIWRAPNIYEIGNYLTPVSGGANEGRTATVLTLDEGTVLVDWAVKKSSKNIRERVFVGNTSGRFSAASAGYNPNPTGLRRVGGYTDQNFSSNNECQVMADFITMRQAFTYRTGVMKIAANPEIQIDDQVFMRERRTEEYYYHYVKSIHCSWDLETGRWDYDLTTHWLGETPFDKWAFNPAELSLDTQEFLAAIGKV